MKLAIVVALIGCGGKTDEAPKTEAKPEAKPADPKPADSPTKPPPKPGRDLGSCTAKITGGATADIASQGSTSKVVASYWFAPDDKHNIMFPEGKIGLIINCNDDHGTLSFVAGSKVTKESLPFGPKKYELKKGLGGDGLHALGTVGKTSLMGVVGTFEITAFDNKHVAGTFQLTAKTLPNNGEAKIEGTFDYTCDSFSGCAK